MKQSFAQRDKSYRKFVVAPSAFSTLELIPKNIGYLPTNFSTRTPNQIPCTNVY